MAPLISVLLFLAAINMASDSLHPADFLSSFDFKDDLLAWAWSRANSKIDCARNGGTWIVNWLSCLDHHISILVFAAAVNVTHFENGINYIKRYYISLSHFLTFV